MEIRNLVVYIVNLITTWRQWLSSQLPRKVLQFECLLNTDRLVILEIHETNVDVKLTQFFGKIKKEMWILTNLLPTSKNSIYLKRKKNCKSETII